MSDDPIRSLKVDQAFYGESRGGHSLLGTSGDRALSNSLTSRLDLPDTAPPGIEWSPFVSGFPLGKYYIVASTALDANAKRSGMVSSHALIINLNDLILIGDLRPLLKLFTGVFERQRPEAVLLQLQAIDEPYPAVPLAATVEALLARGTGPVVCIGTHGFDDLIAALWANLWPDLRKNLSFRMSFGPSDLVEPQPPTLVCTPISLAGRWSKFRTVSDLSTNRSVSLASALLQGEAEGWSLREFARDIGATLESFSEVSLAEQAYELSAAEGTNFESIVTALRLVERLSPDPSAGVIGKVTLLDKLCRHIDGARSADIAVLRNMNYAALPERDRVWHVLSKWFKGNMFATSEDAGMLSLASYAVSKTESEPGWRSSVLAGFVSVTRVSGSPFFAAFWRWAEIQPKTAVAILEWLPNEAPLEKQLSKSAPLELRETTCSSLMELALSRKWLSLHGALVSAGYTVGEAVRRQLAVDANVNSLDGLILALRRSTPLETIACAMELEEPRLIRIAGEAAGKDVSLLGNLDYRSSAAQAIWEKALTLDVEAWRGPMRPSEAFEVVLTGLIEGSPTNTGLVQRLSASPLADLCAYSRRDKVWVRADVISRQRLLTATAGGWLRQASSAVPFMPDFELQRTILADARFVSTLDALLPAGITAGVAMFETLSAADEQSFIRWMSRTVSVTRSIVSKDAESIGRLVLARNWSIASEDLIRLEKTGRSDLRAALRVCYPMLSVWTRFGLGLAPISSAEKWDLLEEVATDIYSDGPDHDELWSRAGGNNADLQRNGTGRSRWHVALGHLRVGKHPGVNALLRQMRADLPMNDKLAYLADDPEFRGPLGL